MSAAETPDADTCPEVYYVERPLWKFVTCGRPVRRDGRCGIHARQREQQAAQRRARTGGEGS